MNATANKSQSKNLNVISTMNEKLLEMSVKVCWKAVLESRAGAVNRAGWVCPEWLAWARISSVLSRRAVAVQPWGHERPFCQSIKVGTLFIYFFLAN